MSKGSLNKLENVSLWIQNCAQIATALAALSVVAWAYYSTVYVKKEKEVTEYMLRELEQKTTQESHIQVKVEPSIQPAMDGRNLLQVKVILANLGNKEGRVILDHEALVLVPVTFVEGKPIYEKPIDLRLGRYGGTPGRVPLDFVNIGAGESYEITFVQSLENPGVYLIHFLALHDMATQDGYVDGIGVIPYRYAVGADEYVVVK